MKILCIADEEDPWLWDYFKAEKLQGIDLIISCGDLDADYLSFLVTMSNLPVFYVHGNHDALYDRHPPEGCVCIDDKVIDFYGLRIVGLGGSPQYSGGAYQYSERQMTRKVLWARMKLLHPPVTSHPHGQSFGSKSTPRPLTTPRTLIVSHAPPRGYGDMDDRAHRGFTAFLPLLQRQPDYWIHGHVHMRYLPGAPRVRKVSQTTLINVCGRYLLEMD